MKIGIRIVICTILCALALTMAVFTLAGFASRRETGTAPEAEAYYMLGEQDGNVAVFFSRAPEQPVTVTGIELAQLRETDRSMIRAGVLSGSKSEMLRLLEDLGS